MSLCKTNSYFLKKSQQTTTKRHAKLPSMQRVQMSQYLEQRVKDTTQYFWQGSNSQPLNLKSSEHSTTELVLNEENVSQSAPIASLDMILSKKRMTKELIRLSICAGWSAPLLFPEPQKTGFLPSRPISGLPLNIYFKIP